MYSLKLELCLIHLELLETWNSEPCMLFIAVSNFLKYLGIPYNSQTKHQYHICFYRSLIKNMTVSFLARGSWAGAGQ